MALVLSDDTDSGPWRKAVGLGWVSVWLVFLGSPLEQVWRTNGGVGRTVGISLVVAFALLYIALFATARMSWRTKVREGEPRPRRLFVMLAVLALLMGASAPFAGGASLTMVVYVGAASMFTFRPNVGVATVVLLAICCEIASRVVPGWQDEQWSASFATLFAGAAVFATRVAARRSMDLSAAREEMAVMAIEEERNRMTRDLHDILGHSLTVITVKAQLASRLIGSDEARATAEVADIERLAREALTDVRATIAGKREVSLAPELVNARAALDSANIDADIPNALDDVAQANRELFGWAVREGVTNVLRHSRASRCAIRLTSTSVEIHDDGVGAGSIDLDGNGLRGLRERVACSGASILTGTSPDLGGFLLHVSTRTAAAERHDEPVTPAPEVAGHAASDQLRPEHLRKAT